MTRPQWRFLFSLWRQVRGGVALVLVLSAVGMAARAYAPAVLKRVFDAMAEMPGAPALGAAAAAYLAVSLTERIFQAALVFLRAALNARFEWLSRTRAFASLVRLGPSFLRRHPTGDLVTRLTDDVAEKLAWFACSGVFRALAASAVIVFAFVAMARLDPVLAVVTSLPLPALAWLHVRTGRPLQAKYDTVQASLSALNGAFEACFSGIRVVKAYGRERGEEAVVARLAGDCARAEVAAARWQVLMDSLYGQGWQLAVAAVLLVGGLSVMSGRITLGTLVAFDAYAFMLAWPMLDLGAFLVRGRQASTCIGRILEIEDAAPDVSDAGAVAGPPPGLRGELALERVGLTHSDGLTERIVLRDVTLAISPGERVAIVGPVGAGKSQLLRLPSRLVDPDSGRLLLAGRDLREWPLSELRRSVALVPQEALLFSGTIADNVRFGRESVDDDAIRWAVGVARLERDLAAWTDGMATRVGVRGVTLSGGQAQRVALARALAGKPDVLVLDDVTSALDAETEAALWDELDRVLPGLSVLFATHRTATLERADRIVVLDEGRVVQSGRHAELVRAPGLYASLYQRHAREERVGEA